MREISDEDFNEARMLARQVGAPDERIDFLRVQYQEDADQMGGGPWTLMASAGEGTLVLLLSRWLGSEYAERLSQAGTRPLVIGPTPERLLDRPGFRGWAANQEGKLGGRGHIVALTTDGELSAKLSGEIARVGGWDSVIVVTRASMPLPQNERELVRSLSKTVAVGRVLVVAVPGELPAAVDVLKVEEYARRKLEANGFGGVRCGGVSFWWLDGELRNTHAVADPAELLVRDAQAAARGRDLVLRNGLVDFLGQVERKAVASGVKPLTELSEDELKEMEENFSKALTGVMRKAEAEFREATGATDAKLRGFVIDQILGWGRGGDFSGVWLNFVDTVRPGAKTGLFDKVKVAAEVLSVEPPARHSPRDELPLSSGTSPALPTPSRPGGYTVSDHALRVGFAVASGVVLWAVTPATILGGVLAAGAAAGGALLGYVIGGPVVAFVRRVVQRQSTRGFKKEAADLETKVTVTEGKIRNFNLFERQLMEWLSQHIRAEKIDVAGRCRALAQRVAPAG